MGMTQVQLGVHLGMTSRNITHYESGTRNIPIVVEKYLRLITRGK